jgi:hypothetical protein
MLDIRGASPGLLDDPLLLEVGGAPPNAALTWRGRLRDDDGFVWRTAAPTPEGLLPNWVPAKPTAGPLMALRSLRPVDVDVRVEATDGAASSRTITRKLIGDGVRARRWKDGIEGTLYLPDGEALAAHVIDARPAANPEDPDVDAVLAGAPLAAALLASRGVLTFVLTGGKGDPAEAALERLAQIPGAPEIADRRTTPALEIGVPPGVGYRGETAANADVRALAWDALLARLGARPRRVAR